QCIKLGQASGPRIQTWRICVCHAQAAPSNASPHYETARVKLRKARPERGQLSACALVDPDNPYFLSLTSVNSASTTSSFGAELACAPASPPGAPPAEAAAAASDCAACSSAVILESI